MYGALISHSPQKNWQSICFLKIPPLIVIKFALVSRFFLFSPDLLLSSPSVCFYSLFSFSFAVIPHCHAAAPSHRPLLSAPVQQRVTGGRGARVIGGCQLPSLTTDTAAAAMATGLQTAQGTACRYLQRVAEKDALMVCHRAPLCFKAGLTCCGTTSD